jgi:hypothetical protein
MGGLQQSGVGREMGFEAIEPYTEVRASGSIWASVVAEEAREAVAWVTTPPAVGIALQARSPDPT